MKRLLSFLLDGCWHTWRATHQATYSESLGSWGEVTMKAPCVYVVCTKCGARKVFKGATIGDWEGK